MRRNTYIERIDLQGDGSNAHVIVRFPNCQLDVTPEDLDNPETFRKAMRRAKCVPDGPFWDGSYKTRGRLQQEWIRRLNKAFGTMDSAAYQRWTEALKTECKKRGIAV